MKREGVISILCGVMLAIFMNSVTIHAENMNNPSSKEIIALERKMDLTIPITIRTRRPLNEGYDNYITYEYVYMTFNSECQTVYKKIVQSIEHHKNLDYQKVDFADKLMICEIDLSEFEINSEDIAICFWGILSDHTEYFFVCDTVYYYLDKETGEKFLYVMASDECGDRQIREEVYGKLNRVVEKIKIQVSEMESTAEKVRYIDEYIRKNFTYASVSEDIPEVNDITSSVASILEGRAICAGYARMNHFVLNHLGINTIYVTGMVDEGYHAWNYIFVEEENQWYASDVTFSDGGEKILLRGNDILKTHKPLKEGLTDDGFGYPLPELSGEDFIFDNDQTEESGESVNGDGDTDINFENDDTDNKNDSSEGIQDELKDDLSSVPETEDDRDTQDENDTDEGEEKIDNSADMENDKGASVFEENTNGETYKSDMGIILPINPDMNSWVEVGGYMEEIDITMDDGSITKGWVGIPVPGDTMYKWDGEVYINGISADLFYTFEAQKSDNVRVKIANYKEACKYNPTDASLYFNIGYYYSQEGNYKGAFTYYMEAIKRGDTTGAVDNILLLIERHKDETERQGEYLKVLELVPNDERVLNKVNY